jgi:hypothetical protein
MQSNQNYLYVHMVWYTVQLLPLIILKLVIQNVAKAFLKNQ